MRFAPVLRYIASQGERMDVAFERVKTLGPCDV
jgi:hypothetical protein